MSFAIAAVIVMLLSILFEKHTYQQLIKGLLKPAQAEKLVRIVDLVAAIAVSILIALALLTA